MPNYRKTERELFDSTTLYDKFGEILSDGDEVLVLGSWRGYIISVETQILTKEAGPEPIAIVEYRGKTGRFVTPELQLVRYSK